MPLQVLIAPDKFKGTLTARAAAEAMARGWRSVRPQDNLELLPISDGGDGFGEILAALHNPRLLTVETVDAAHHRCRARWWWVAPTKTAIIESAEVIGLAKLPPGKFHPFDLDTFGLGAVIKAAVAKGAQKCLLGIGGSATNDGGFGLARALGWEFLDRRGKPITAWTQLHTLAELRAPGRSRWFPSLIVAVDVQNPLLGPRGCTRVYGPQKDLRKQDFVHAERCLRQLAKITARKLGRDCSREPGVGAAGGLGFGLRSFLGARLAPGFELFARHSQLSARLHATDLVLTGEGAIDRQTLMGKGVGQIGQWCRERGVPCLALAGSVTRNAERQDCFTAIHTLTELTTLEEAKRRPTHWLRILAARLAAASTAEGCSRKLQLALEGNA